MKPISHNEFFDKKLLKVEHILEGFDQYEHVILHGSEAQYREFVKGCLDLNGQGNAYFDFYYARLELDAKKKFLVALAKEEKEIVQGLQIEEDEIYYSLQEEMIDMLVGVTARELLFSSFYFENQLGTLWGNYGLRWPMFFESEAVKRGYIELAKKCGLKVEV